MNEAINPPKDMPIDEQLYVAQVAIEGALASPEILAALAEYRYDAARLQEGQALYTAAQAAQQHQQERYSEQFSATAAYNEAFAQTRKTFVQARQLARLAAQTHPHLPFEKLKLSGGVEQAFAAWLIQARIFYEAALNDIGLLAKMEEYGLTHPRLQAGLEATTLVEALNMDQEHKKGEAQAATKARDTALAELRQWMKAFRQVALIALGEQPQLLENLGFGTGA